MTAPRGPSSFRQSDVVRAIKAHSIATGVPREWIRAAYGRDGLFYVSVAKPNGEHTPGAWDDAVAALERDDG